MHSQYHDHVWGPQVKDPSLESPLTPLLPPSPHLKACLAQVPSRRPVSPGRHNASQEQAGPGRGDQGTPEGHRWPEGAALSVNTWPPRRKWGAESGAEPGLLCAPTPLPSGAPTPREGPTYLFGELFCLIVEVGFHQSERIDAFHIAGNK